MEKWMSRKLAVALGLTALCTWLLYLGAMTDTVWAQFMSVNVVGYMLGNGMEHIAKK